jgi:hypothetical protein
VGNLYRRFVSGWIAVLVMVLLISTSASAQVTAGSLRGVVNDPNGAVMVDVAVRATNLQTNITSSTTSTTSGVFVIGALPVGQYRVELQAPGFKTYTREPVEIATATTSTLNVTMEVGELTQNVTVNEASTPFIQTANAEIASSIEEKVIMDLPLQMTGDRRQVENFVFLTPGVTGSTFSKSFNGSPDLSQAAVVEGIAFSNAEVPGRFYTFSPPYEAVEEFKVSSTLYTAEVGRAFGVANYTFKSGTNSYHGDLFEYLRNDKLDARGFFANSKLPTRQNEFGGTFGGPIIKNRTFFFAAYDGFRKAGGDPNRSLVTLPTDQFRHGDFSKWVDSSGKLIQIYDPATTKPDGKGGFTRDPFPGNMIPAGRIDPIAQKVIDLLPLPDYPDRVVGNFVSRAGSPTALNIISYKVDHQLSSKHKLSGSHWFNFDNTGAAFYELGNGQPLDRGYPGGLQFHGIRVNEDWVASPRVLNHFAFGFSGTFHTGRGIDPRNGADILPIPGLPSQYNGLTGFNISGLPKLGNAGEQGDSRYDHTYNYTDTLSILRGKHQLKFGGEYWAQSFRNFDQTAGGGPAGNLFFGALETDLPNSPTFGQAGNSFASFLLGQVDRYQRQIGAAERTFKIPYAAFFGADTIQLTSKLTLNLGLRYELAFPWRDEDPGRISAINLTTPNPGAGGRPGAYVYGNDAVVPEVDKKAFGPRIGVTYALNNKTVVRAGFGIIYSVSNAATTGASQFGNSYQLGFTAVQDQGSINNGITAVRLLRDGFPQFTGTLPNRDPALNIGGVADYYNPGGAKQAYQQTWTLDVQRELPFGIFADAAYVGNHGLRLPGNLENLNQVPVQYLGLGPLLNQPIDSPEAIAAGFGLPYPGFTGTVGQALRPYPQYLSINNSFQPSGSSSYNSMQVKVQKRFSDGLSFLTSYTLSKTLTNTGLSGFAIFNNGARDTANRGLEKGLAGNDRTHNLVTSFVYELPFSRGAKGAAGKLARGWSLAGVVRYQSGTPIGIGGGPPLPLFGGGNAPNRIPDVSARSNVSAGDFDPATDRYLNPAAFSQPAPFTFGTGGRIEPNLRSFAFYNEDLAIIKRTSITESMNVEFRSEFFNILNRVVFGAPSSDFNDPTSFGRVFGPGNNPRQIQFGLKFNF